MAEPLGTPCLLCGSTTLSLDGPTLHCESCGWTAHSDDLFEGAILVNQQGQRDTEAEQMLHDLLAPKTEEQARQRRAERDLSDADTLRRIVRKHHQTYVEGLTDDDLRVLTTVAFRLTRGANEVLHPEPTLEPDLSTTEGRQAALARGSALITEGNDRTRQGRDLLDAAVRATEASMKENR